MKNNYASYLRLFLAVFLGLALFLRWFYCPGSAWWIAKNGDNATRRSGWLKRRLRGHFVALFRIRHFPRIFVDYKLPPLRRCPRPVIAAVGSSG